jgi:undecaprenyl-diphosphatase
MHSDFFDFLMYRISSMSIWIPFYLFLTYLVIRNYKWRTIDIIIAVALLITISDMSSVNLFKEIFHRLRPCHDPEIMSLVHLVNGACGGKYSFVSSHAANTFALSFFLIIVLGKKVKYLTPCMIIWASVVSYTRIYLGVHYPLDVMCGAILGIVIGIGVGKLFMWYYEKWGLKK